MTADGLVSLIGCLINAVYIGHPGWKAMGGRMGYSAATGIMVILLCWFGTISVMLALIPAVAIVPILLYIAMLIGHSRKHPRRMHQRSSCRWYQAWECALIFVTVGTQEPFDRLIRAHRLRSRGGEHGWRPPLAVPVG